MVHMVRLHSRGWSLARQLIALQLVVVVTAVAIEAMVAVYRAPKTADGWEQQQIIGLVTLTEVALLVGISGSLFLADRVRRQTFDMEPAEIARRYQHHEAMLHAVREGLIITDVSGAVVLANDEARRLLALADDCVGQALRELVGDADWAAAEREVTDQPQYAADRVLMVSRSQAEVEGVPAGMVTTLRDRTELQQALQELDVARVVSIELRKQAHEHAEHLQMIIALIESERYEEAITVCAQRAEKPRPLSSEQRARITDPVLAARLQGARAYAEQRGVELRLDGTTGNGWQDISHDLADIVGGLAGNAIDAATERGPGGWVEISVAPRLHISVRDSGPGIPVEPADHVFDPGFTTKGDGHGVGLAMVKDKVGRLNGTIDAYNDGGAVFDVCIPESRDAGSMDRSESLV